MNENILKRLTKNKSGIISSLDDLEKCIKIFFLKYAFIYYYKMNVLDKQKIRIHTKLSNF